MTSRANTLNRLSITHLVKGSSSWFEKRRAEGRLVERGETLDAASLRLDARSKVNAVGNP